MHLDNPIQENINTCEPTKQLSSLLVMVCIYIFLIIERPWESVRYFEGVPIERSFAIVMLIIAMFGNRLKIISFPTNKWVFALLILHFILAPFAFNTGYAVNQGIEYSKIVILYILMLTVVDDEKTLKLLVKAYVFSMMFYVTHSLWEYHNGRHFYRMGIARMIGVDSTANDPNSFGASLVLSLPFVYALLRTESRTLVIRLYYTYFALAILCVVLTGSRSSFIGMIFTLMIWSFIQKGKQKITFFIVFFLSLSVLWTVMPEDKRDRIRTLWDKDAGPVNAHESAEGRKYGWQASLIMFKQKPLTGVGAGGQNFIGYRMTNHIDTLNGNKELPLQSHVLYGEVLAELGLIGGFCFTGLVLSIIRCCVRARSRLALCGASDSFISLLGGAIIACILLLLLFGCGGHNFYRPLWLWLAAWSGCLFILSRKMVLVESTDS